MYVSGSGVSQRSASAGCRLKCSSRPTSGSNSSSSMRCDCASTPTRGSRLMGLLSMIITSVLGSGLCAQAPRKITTETQRHREKKRLLFTRWRKCSAPTLDDSDISQQRFLSDFLFSLCLCVSVVNFVVLRALRVLSGENQSLCVTNLPENRRSLRSRSRRHIRGQSPPRLVRQQ